MNDVSTSDFKERANQLVEKAKTVTTDVTVSSILPCNRSDTQHVAALNTELRATCSELNVKFVDNDCNFTFRDGTIDTAAYHTDRLHLSQRGVDRLLSNLSLSSQAPIVTKNGRQQQRRRQDAGNQRSTMRDGRNNREMSDNEWRLVERHYQHRHTTGQCSKCGEANHVIANCRHSAKVQCRLCGSVGHKEKHHAQG